MAEPEGKREGATPDEPAEAVAGVEIRVALEVEDVTPEIWRTVEVDPELTLDRLHEVLQVAIGWRHAHLYRFHERWQTGQDPGRAFGPPREWLGELSLREGLAGLKAAEMTVGRLLEEMTEPPVYEYDFGDGWSHRLQLTRIRRQPAEPGAVVTAGERSAPPEDCGGPPGYRNLLEGMETDKALGPDGPDREWADMSVGPWRNFDPEHFDIKSVNEELAFRFPDSDPTAETAGGGLGELDWTIGQLAPGYRVELREHVRRQGVREPVEPDPEQAAAILRPYLWLLDRVGEDGIKLTQAGWLPPKVVQACMGELEWGDTWIGKQNREHLTPPVFGLRESAQQLKLLRKYRGRLKLTRMAAALRHEPALLLTHVAAGLVTLQPDGVDRDATLLALIELAGGGPRQEREWMERIAAGLDLRGYRDVNGDPPDAEDVPWFLGGLHHALDRLGAFATPEDRRQRLRWRPASPAGRLIARLALREA